MQITLDVGQDAVKLGWPDGTTGQYPYVWLRDNCPTSFHPETEERTLDLLKVPEWPTPRQVDVEDSALRIDWAEEAHQSRYPLTWLRSHRPGAPEHDPGRPGADLWRAEIGAEGVPRHDAHAILTTDEGLRAWLHDTIRLGVSIVTGVEKAERAGIAVAERVGFLSPTNFGTTFQVRNIPNPNNIAYTAEALPLHTDLANQELPPGFQFLHCIANEATGGGSILADGAAIIEDLRVEDPEAFHLLSTVPVPFRFHDSDNDIRSHHPVIALDSQGTVIGLNWNEHLTDVFDLPPDMLRPYYRAYRAIMSRMRSPDYMVTLRLEGGDMLVFDNRRILHGRASFDPSTGYRHLEGFYVDRVSAQSRLRVLSRAG